MGNAIHIQYVGFKTKSRLREYTFLVHEGQDEAREFKLTIPNAAFLSRRARYQDGPDICSHRVQREMDANNKHPLKTRCAITDAELEEYRVAHFPKYRPGPTWGEFDRTKLPSLK